MNLLLTALMASGAIIGLGSAGILAALTRWHPALPDALAMLDERLPHNDSGAKPAATSSWPQRLLGVLARRLPSSVDERDLRILQLDRNHTQAGRLAQTLAFAAGGPALAVLLYVLDASLPLAVPVGFTVIGGAVGWSSYSRRIQDRAEEAREEMRYALVAYLQQVSLLRRGGAGVATALSLPAQLLDNSWAMRQIGHHIEMAERSGLMPWDGLRRFGAMIDVTELDDLSTIAETAGQDGGAVIDTLLARAESLNDELLADAHTDANRASAQMSTPGAVQVFLIAAWVLYPAASALLNA
jgi:Flp pilus assembly protein TadB